MKASEFLRAILPPNGSIVIGVSNPALPAAERFSNKFFSDVESAERFLLSRPSGQDLYYGVSSYNKRRRTQQNVAAIQVLFLDIDCGPGKAYATKKAGLTALIDFCKTAKYPQPSLLVDSGNGIHPYWKLNAPVSRETWEPLALHLKQLVATHGFQVDNSITADSARVLRPPGTLNFKDQSAPKPVKLLLDTGKVYTPEQLGGGAQAVTLPRLAAVSSNAAPMNDDLSGGIETRKAGPFYAQHIVEACEVFKDLAKTGGEGCAEPFWHQYLNVLAFCEDGEHWAHELSKGHLTYSHSETEKKFRYKKNHSDERGPTLCKTLGMHNPEACARCPFATQVRTPLMLGLAAQTGVPQGFSQDDEGVYKKNEEGGWDKILPYKVVSAEIITDHDTGEVALYLSLLDNKRHRAVAVPYSALADRRSLSKVLGKAGLPLHPASYKPFTALIMSWMAQLDRNRAARTLHSHMGWVEASDGHAFAVGDTLYTKQGEVKAPHSIDKVVAGFFEPRGSMEHWQRAAQHVVDNGHVSLSVCMALAFAAPLIYMTAVPAMMCTFVSRESGYGKSTAMMLSQAVWGDPEQAMHALDDTYASVIRKLGTTNNLPAYWDELRGGKQTEEFLRSVLFRLAQGKEKSRLTSGAKLTDTANWKTIMAVASNSSILDYAVGASGESNAGILRMMEFRVEGFSTHVNQVAVLADIGRHYGHVGRLYAALLAHQHDDVQKRLREVHAKLTAQLQVPANARFWIAGMSCLIVGAQIATAQGWLRFDVRQLAAYLVRVFRQQTDTMKQESSYEHLTVAERYARILYDYIDDHIDSGLDTVAMQHTRGKPPADVDVVVGLPPRKFPLMWQRAGLPDPTVRIPKNRLRDWMFAHGTHTVADLHGMTTLFNVRRIRTAIGMHTIYAGVGRTECLDFPLSHPALEQMMPALTQEEDDGDTG